MLNKKAKKNKILIKIVKYINLEEGALMETSELYKMMEDENIYYINHHLSSTQGMIAHYKDLTVIVVDDKKIKGQVGENTVLIQELGHYMAGAYYNTNSPYELIQKMEHNADKKAWETFFPYEEIKKLMKNGLTTATQLAEYYHVEAPYMARCLNYYYDKYNRFD